MWILLKVLQTSYHLSKAISLFVLMMAQLGDTPSFSPVSVIGSQFIAPYQFDIIVDRSSRGSHVITDNNHKILFKVKSCNTSFHLQRVLLDVDDKPIVTIRQKIMTEHYRWNVFKGDSKRESDIIFTTKTPHMIQFKTGVQVFLANKASNKKACDFKIEGSWSKKNCTINMGDTSATIAQMYKMQSSENIKFASDKFKVTIYPGVDYAFVVTLIAIVEAMKKDEVAAAVSGGVVGGVIGAAFA
ncbi:hypothetical protein LXL04_019358 [Taraxacum kok-saghyz]